MGGTSKFWLIADGKAGGMEFLTIRLASGGEALPVFSFEDEAAMFLGLGGAGGGWRVRKTTAGELVSILFGAGVGRVALDPLPGSCGVLNDLVSVDRDSFMKFIEEPRRDTRFDRFGGKGRRNFGLRGGVPA